MGWHLLGLALLAVFDPSALQRGVTHLPPPGDNGGVLRLAAGERRVVFEAPGAGLIRELWMTPPTGQARALRLLMTWDGAAEPSVDAPVVDLLGAVPGAPDYSCLLGQVTSAVWALRLPMPFADGAKVELLNDAPGEVVTTFGCQWDALTAPPDRGRLHVAWRRATVGVPGRAALLEVSDTPGQVAAVRLSAELTDAVEALPGQLRAQLDGQPDGLVASNWTELFRNRPGGLQPEAGRLRDELVGDLRSLAGYRTFPEPLHFEQSCRLALDLTSVQRPTPAEVDLTSTVYWYARSARPSGGAPLDWGERLRGFRGMVVPLPPTPEELFARLGADRDAILGFDEPTDWLRVLVRRPGPGHPRWIGNPTDEVGQPHPGRQGIGVLAPPEAGYTCRMFWKVLVPPGARLLRYTLSADPHRSPEDSEVHVTLALCDGQGVTQLRSRNLSGRGGPTTAGWLSDTSPIGRVGESVLVIVEVSGGANQPELFIDRLSIE